MNINSLNLSVQDPKKYIDTIISVYEKYHNLVLVQFKKDVGFAAALDKACAIFINKNAVTEQSGISNKSAEALAAYCHVLLKKSSKNVQDIELDVILNQLMAVFRYIEDKDVFEGFYKKRLAERLV